MALLIIIVSQKQLLLVLNKRLERQERGLEDFNKQYMRVDSLKGSLEQLLAKGTEELQGLQAALTGFSPAIEERKTKIDACLAAKNTIHDELVGAEKTNAEAKDAFKPESDAWKQQIDTLNAQLTGHRSVCDHVKDDPAARKLCNTS